MRRIIFGVLMVVTIMSVTACGTHRGLPAAKSGDYARVYNRAGRMIRTVKSQRDVNFLSKVAGDAPSVRRVQGKNVNHWRYRYVLYDVKAHQHVTMWVYQKKNQVRMRIPVVGEGVWRINTGNRQRLNKPQALQ